MYLDGSGLDVAVSDIMISIHALWDAYRGQSVDLRDSDTKSHMCQHELRRSSK